jgi:hypothetical protein
MAKTKNKIEELLDAGQALSGKGKYAEAAFPVSPRTSQSDRNRELTYTAVSVTAAQLAQEVQHRFIT